MSPNKEKAWYHNKLQEFQTLPIQIVERTKDQNGYKTRKNTFQQIFPDWQAFFKHFETEENVATLKKIVHFLRDYYMDYQDVENGETPLHYACKMGNLEMVKILCPFSIGFNAISVQQMTPLHCACENGRTEVVKFLLDHSQKKGIIINTTNRFGWTPLHMASLEGHAEVVNLILERADELEIQINAADISGQTAFDLAEERQHEEIIFAFQELNKRSVMFRT